jgi:UDP-N-acetylglucosamine--N-acetylmuramyl-(pentapeptide) pyrophosphoryl-undecaprenol N-acetylglucosamine transferase
VAPVEGGALRLLVAAGGTGGHVYPGIAIAEEWRRAHPQTEVIFVGTGRGLEAKVVPQAGFPLRTIQVRGFPRKNPLGMLQSAWAFLGSLFQTSALLRELKPGLVVGTGGYVSGPVVLMARLSGIPVVIQEQNSVPGSTNRWLSLIADQVHISFVESRNHFRRRNNLKVSGNPIRRSLMQHDRAGSYEPLGLSPERRTLFVFGGSHGARSINEAVAGALPLLRGIPDLQVLWQTGQEDRAAMQERAKGLPFPVRVVAYLDTIGRAYAVSDLVICRAGAMTIAELTACGAPAILVPYPHATHDHQTHNARGLADRGAAEMIADRDLTPGELAKRVEALFRDDARRRTLGRNARAFARTDAAQRIVRSIEELLHLGGAGDA